MTEPSGGSTDKPRRPVVVPALALVAFTAVGITALLGGLNERPDPPPKALNPGQTLDQGQFDTQVVESKVIVEKAENQFAEDKRYLDVVFKVTNKTDQTVSVGAVPHDKSRGFFFGSTLLKMTPQIKTEFGPDLFVLSKGVTSRQLHPGIQSTVVARYELDAATQPPKQVSYDMGAMEHHENPLTGVSNWFLVSEPELLTNKLENKVVAKITLSVEPQGA
ncbi:hypothetical protein OHA25_01740 [Nonomuraea sp. NBC_00507]|uniref:hypothetical protein n=1 Tax=Nonomuraea sp. NBC_00507 TaxID=2976002 RepID=UPI002E16CFDC